MSRTHKPTKRSFRRLSIAPGQRLDVERAAAGDPEFREYARYLSSPRRVIAYNFIAGIFRGIGMAVGFSLLGAVLVYFLQRIAWQHIPVLSEFITEIIKTVQAKS